ncbi:unnamed protein product [Malus baccata var. baccata]
MAIAGTRSSDTMGLKGGVILLGFVAFALFSCVADGLSGADRLLGEGEGVRRSLAENDTAWSLKFVLAPSFLVLYFNSINLHALNIGVQATDASIVLLLSNHNVFSLPMNSKNLQSKDCSRECESEFCTVPPFLKYGKYCGLLYSGCPGEQPCDGLDACCMKHDNCVQSKNNDYLSSECSQTFLNCMAEFKNKRGKTFKGNKCHVEDVVEVITLVMEAALVAGRYLHKP